MALNLVTGPSFPSLSRQLILDLRSASPDTPQWVVTPTAATAHHVRLQLMQAAGEGVVVGVRVAPLNAFLNRLCRAFEINPGSRSGPSIELALFRLVQSHPQIGLVRSLPKHSEGFRRLLPTFLDLADGGFGPPQIELLLELARQKDNSHTEREVLALYALWLQQLEETGTRWKPLQMQSLAQAVEEAAPTRLEHALAGEARPPVVSLTGFYDFTDVNLQVLITLAKKLDCRLYFPLAQVDEAPHPAFSYAAGVLDDLRLRIPQSDLQTQPSVQTADPPARFLLDHFPEGPASPRPDFFEYQRASGLEAEALAAACCLRRWMHQDPSLQPQDVLVTAPSPERYRGPLSRAFAQFSIPLRMIDVPLGLTADAQAVNRLAALWEQEAPAELLLHHLRQLHEGEEWLEVLEARLRELEIWGGSSWSRAADNSPLTPSPDSSSQDRPVGADPGLEVEPDFASEPDLGAAPDLGVGPNEDPKAVCALWVERILELTSLRDSQQALTAQEAATLLQRWGRIWLPQPSLLRPIEKALHELAKDDADLKLPPTLLRSLLRSVAEKDLESDDFNRQAVLFTSFMRSRGLTARRLIMLGLSSRTLPLRIDEDPLLGDEVRLRLRSKAQAVGHRLPIKTAAAEEQTLLFLLVNSSALEAVHWVIPQCDESGRRTAATPWVQRFLNHWGPSDQPSLLQSPREQALTLHQMDPGQGRYLPPSLLPLLSEGVSRPHPRAFRIGNARLPRIDVAGLESLARCSYRFYAERIASWTALEPLSMKRGLSPIDRGQVLHRTLQLALADSPEQGSSLAQTARRLTRDLDSLRGLVERCTKRVLAGRGPSPDSLVRAAVEEMTRTLSAYFAAAIEASESYPSFLESMESAPFPGLPGTRIVGRIDRIDAVNFGTRILDYKSGRRPARLGDRIKAGFSMQPTLYPWLRQEGPGHDDESDFAFVFLGADPPKTLRVDSAKPEDLLAPLAAILTRGYVFPVSNEVWRRLGLPDLGPCEHCRLESLCRRHDAGTARSWSQLLERMAPERTAFLKQHFAPEKPEVPVPAMAESSS